MKIENTLNGTTENGSKYGSVWFQQQMNSTWCLRYASHICYSISTCKGKYMHRLAYIKCSLFEFISNWLCTEQINEVFSPVAYHMAHDSTTYKQRPPAVDVHVPKKINLYITYFPCLLNRNDGCFRNTMQKLHIWAMLAQWQCRSVLSSLLR